MLRIVFRCVRAHSFAQLVKAIEQRLGFPMIAVVLCTFTAHANCDWDGAKGEGSVVKMADGLLHICKDGQWQLVDGPKIKVLHATWGVPVHACDMTKFVAHECNGRAVC